MSRRLPTRVAVAAAVLAVTMTMSGCAQPEADYGAELADRLQGEVLEVSQLSAQADFAGALLALNELEVELKDARARGVLTEERYESILAATALVRADLQAAIDALTPPPPPEPPPVVDGGGGDGGGDDAGDDAGDDDGDEGNEGNGNKGNNGNGNEGNNGNGNGNKGNKGKGNGNGKNG